MDARQAQIDHIILIIFLTDRKELNLNNNTLLDNLYPQFKVPKWKPDTYFWIMFTVSILLLLSLLISKARAEEVWKITAYCACERCCEKKPNDPAYGIMASGKKVYPGAIALNWLPFGTKVKIESLGTFTVEDRGAKSLFGDKINPIRHLDIYMNSHKEALNFGVQYKKVVIK